MDSERTPGDAGDDADDARSDALGYHVPEYRNPFEYRAPSADREAVTPAGAGGVDAADDELTAADEETVTGYGETTAADDEASAADETPDDADAADDKTDTADDETVAPDVETAAPGGDRTPRPAPADPSEPAADPPSGSRTVWESSARLPPSAAPLRSADRRTDRRDATDSDRPSPPAFDAPLGAAPAFLEALARRPRAIIGAIVVTVLIVGVIVFATTVSGDGDRVEPPESTAAAVATPTTAPTRSTRPEPSATAPSVPASRTYSGTGNAEIQVELVDGSDVPTVVRIEMAARGKHQITTVPDDGGESTYVTVGYSPGIHTTLFNTGVAPPADRLAIEAAGSWNIVIVSAAALDAFSGTVAGTGPGVYRYTGPSGQATIENANDIDALFALRDPRSGTFGLLTVEAGDRATVRFTSGPSLFWIMSAGEWSVRVT